PRLRGVCRRAFASTPPAAPGRKSRPGAATFFRVARASPRWHIRGGVSMALRTVPPPAPPRNAGTHSVPDRRDSDRTRAAPAAGAPRRDARLRGHLLGLLPPLVFGVVVLALWLLARWQLIQTRGLAAAKLLLPAPTEVLRSFAQILTDPALRG